MPFSGASDPNLPSNVIDRSLEIRRQWVGAWNGRFANCRDDGGSVDSCESSAFAVANAAIKEMGADMSDATDMTDVNVVGEKFGGYIDGPDYYEIMDRQVSQQTAEYNPVGGDTERACSNCQWFVAPNTCVIVSSYPQPIVPNGISNLWKAIILPSDEITPIPVTIVGESAVTEEEDGALKEINKLYGDNPEWVFPNVSKHIGETADKATKTEGGVEFKPSDFAVVPEADTPSDWKLRLAEGSSGNFTAVQVGRAITAMQPGGFRGQRVQLTTEQKSQAVTRIGRVIGRVDGDDDAKDNLRDRLDAVKELTIVNQTINRAKAAFRNALDRFTPVTVVKMIPSRDDTAGVITFSKDKSGATRWIATFSNNFRDRDDPPEVFTDAAHKEFVSYIDQGGEMPELWLWHTPGTSIGKADWIDYANGFITASGTIDPGHDVEIKALANMQDLGLSHGYHYLPGADGAIDWYRTFEISILPNPKAANPWLDFAMMESEVKDMRFNDDKRPFLVTVLGEEKVTTLESDQEGRAKFLNDLGVDSKEYEAPEPKPKDPEPIPAADGSAPDAGVLVDAITKGVVDSDAFKGVIERIGSVEKTIREITASVKALGDSDEAKVARAFMASYNPAGVGHVASQAKDNEVDQETAGEVAGGIDFFDNIVQGGIEATVGAQE